MIIGDVISVGFNLMARKFFIEIACVNGSTEILTVDSNTTLHTCIERENKNEPMKVWQESYDDLLSKWKDGFSSRGFDYEKDADNEDIISEVAEEVFNEGYSCNISYGEVQGFWTT